MPIKTPRIAADASIPYLDLANELVLPIDRIEPEQLSAQTLAGYDAIILRSTLRCDANLLDGTSIKLLTTATAGFDHIDTDYCASKGISWRNAPGCNALSVAQYVLGCLCRLSLRTGIALQGKCLGIVGVGHVGKQLQRLASAMGMRCLLCDPPRAELEGAGAFVSLQEIAEQSDIISFHVPLTQGGAYPTKHLVDEAFINLCKRKPVLINACRGAVSDTKALIRARKDGLLSALIVDCWEGEPHIDKELLRMVDMATPHIAGFSANGKARATRSCLRAIEAFFGLKLEHIDRIKPEAPDNAVIELELYGDHQIERALLHSFDPVALDRDLRQAVDQFETLRKNYHYHHEMASYTIRGAQADKVETLSQLDFDLLES